MRTGKSRMTTHRHNTPSKPLQEDCRAVCLELGIRFFDEIPDHLLDPALVAKVPVEWAQAHALLPVRWEGRVAVLTSDPAVSARQEELALLLGVDLLPLGARIEDIRAAINRCYEKKSETAEGFLRDMQARETGETPDDVRSDDLLRAAGGDAPVTQLVNLILLDALKARASDIHIEPFDNHIRVRYRVDGVLYQQSAPPKHLERALVSRLKVMSHMDIAERRLPQDGQARVRIGEREIDIRVSTLPVAEGERVVLRLLNRDSSRVTLHDLGMPPVVLEPFQRLLEEPHGLIIVSGPTGSGKTTTLYAAIRQTDTTGRNVLTIEEPIEYQLPEIGQMQVKAKIGLTFARGLRHMLRQDPDVILIGETRDAETAEIAVRGALTGHLVLTTLHTNDAPSAVVRMMDIGVEPYLLAASLRGVLSQRLVRRLCPHCRVPAVASEADLRALGSAARRIGDRALWAAGTGCDACLKGFMGRVGIFELYMIDEAAQSVIRHGADAAEKLRVMPGVCRISLVEDGLDKALAGETSLSEVLYVVGRVA